MSKPGLSFDGAWGLLPPPTTSPELSLDLSIVANEEVIELTLRSLLARTREGRLLRVGPSAPVLSRRTQVELASFQRVEVAAVGRTPWMELRPELGQRIAGDSIELRLVSAQDPAGKAVLESGIQVGRLSRQGPWLRADSPFFPCVVSTLAHPPLRERLERLREKIAELELALEKHAPPRLQPLPREAPSQRQQLVRLVSGPERPSQRSEGHLPQQLDACLHWAHLLRIQAIRAARILQAHHKGPSVALAEVAALAASCRVVLGDVVTPPTDHESALHHLTDVVSDVDMSFTAALHRVQNYLRSLAPPE